MKPRNNTEREVCALSKKLLHLSTKQKEWAIDNCSEEERAYSRSNRISHGAFYLVTVCHGWQVLRYFKVMVKYRYHKRTEEVQFNECMQQWMKDGKYVFLAKPRAMGYMVDAFCRYGELQVRTHTQYGFLGDPRLIGYDAVYYSRVQDRYKYIIKDFADKEMIDVLVRSVNASPYSETLIRKDYELWRMCDHRGILFDKEKMMAVKVAMRHRYDSISPEWFDMVDNLAYLKKDLRNPALVCPKDLQKAHNEWAHKAQAARQRNSDRMAELCKLANEKRVLRQMQQQEERAKQQKKEAKSMNKYYVKRMQKYLGLDLTDGLIHIKPLQTINDFYEEGKNMHHCVFSNKYYDDRVHPNSLILSATINSQRIETIELNLKNMEVVQSRGKFNQPSQYHEQILKIIERKKCRFLQ